jgi:hypothetical protein
MSIALDAGDAYSRTTNLPGRAAYTIAGWVKATSLPLSFQTIFALENAASSAGAGAYLGFDAPSGPNAQISIATEGGAAGLRTIAYNSWAFVALVGSGTTLDVYVRLEGEGSLTTVSFTQSTFTEAALYINSDSYAEDFASIRRYTRVWSAALSAVELQAESVSATPVRTSNLNSDFPMGSTTDDNEDASGNGFNLTVAGTPTNSGDEPTITVGGGGRTSKNTRSHPLGLNLGMEIRIPL